MTGSSRQPDFGTQLAMRDRRISEDRLAEHRDALERRVAKSAQRESRMGRAIAALGASMALGILTFWIARVAYPKQNSIEPLLRGIPDFVVALMMALVFLVPISLVVFTFLYLVHYRPQSRSAEQEQLRGMILDMEKQIAELRRRLPSENEVDH